MGYVQIVPRTMPVQRDEKKVKEFKDNYHLLYDSEEVWFYDESGFACDMKPRRIWAKKGSKPVFYYRGNHIRCNLVGAVCSANGEFETLIVPYTDTVVFQLFLDYLKERTENRRIILVMDNASWHKTKGLKWGNIVPVYLPPYSPDLNPIEELWKVIKDRLSDIFPPGNYDQLYDRLQEICSKFFYDKEEVKSICKLPY